MNQNRPDYVTYSNLPLINDVLPLYYTLQLIRKKCKQISKLNLLSLPDTIKASFGPTV